MDFEWDPFKDAANRRKHGVGSDEALTVFADPLARIFADPDHSVDEAREIMIGHSTRQRLLSVVFGEHTAGFESSAHVPLRNASDKGMNKTRRNRKPAADIRREYLFDYAQAKPNRFAAQLRGKVVAVVLQPDVAEVFDSSEAVNRLLRSVIAAVPKSGVRSSNRKMRKKIS